MKRRTRFYILLGIMLFLMLMDGLLTYLNTPDLTREANPLVTVFGLGWGALFTANLLGFLLVFFTGYYSFVRYETVVAPVANRREYMSQLYFGRPDRFVRTLYRLPKNWRPYLALLGYVLLFTMIFHKLVLVFEWLTVDIRVPVYDPLRRMAPYGRLDMVLVILMMIYLVIRWFNREYKRSRALVEQS